MAFCIVPLRSLEVAARLAIPQPLAQAYLAHTDAKFFHCITRASAGSGADWHARMQFYNGEDPATGSASGCTIAYLVRHSLAASGQPIVLEQGIEMLRPSRIYVRATRVGDHVSECIRGWPHHSYCNRTLFPAVMHLISTEPACETASNQALFEDSVNLQSKIGPRFRTVFAVAKMGNPPYCWEALRNENSSAPYKTSIHLGNLRQQNSFSNLTNSAKATHLFFTQI